MALIIKNNKNAVLSEEMKNMGLPLDAPIRILGTEIYPETLYVRLHMIGDAGGKHLTYNAQLYLDKDKYAKNDPVTTTVNPTSGSGVVTEQSNQTLHEVAKKCFERYGYDVTIEL